MVVLPWSFAPKFSFSPVFNDHGHFQRDLMHYCAFSRPAIDWLAAARIISANWHNFAAAHCTPPPPPQHTTSTPDICQMDFIPLISAQKAGQLDYLCRRDLDFFGYPANSNLITPTWHTWKAIRFKSVDCQHLRYPWGPGLKNRKTSKLFLFA